MQVTSTCGEPVAEKCVRGTLYPIEPIREAEVRFSQSRPGGDAGGERSCNLDFRRSVGRKNRVSVALALLERKVPLSVSCVPRRTRLFRP